jgi:proteasome lid subunit RPN8/RPN11
MTALSIHWRDAEPDVGIRSFGKLVQQTNWRNAVALIKNYWDGISVYMTREADQAIEMHVNSESLELGGLLLGRVYSAPSTGDLDYPWITWIEESVPSHEYSNSSVSLRVGTEVWNRASAYLQNGLMVVGWYHSHPNIGAFFSSTDRATQSGFFNNLYSLGLVIDPIRRERKCFWGGASKEFDFKAMVVV